MMIFLLSGSRNWFIFYASYQRAVLRIFLEQKTQMTTYFEETDHQFVKDEINTLLSKYGDDCSDIELLRDLITFSHLLIHTKRVL